MSTPEYDALHRELEHIRELLEVKLQSLEGRVSRTEKGLLGGLLAGISAFFGWLFSR